MNKGYELLTDKKHKRDEMPKSVQSDERKNIIFLDIDGVIQPYGNEYRFAHDIDKTLEVLREKYDPKLVNEGDPWDIVAAYYDWDDVAMGMLAQLCRHTGSYIVLHSSWIEFNSLERLKLFFEFYGMADYVLDVCPVFDWDFYQQEREKSGYYIDHKAIQIRKWLEKHEQEVGQYVVIDDHDMSWSFGDRFIITHDRLKKADYQQARRLLLGYRIENHDEKIICLGHAYAEFKIESIGARRALLFTLGYSTHEDADYDWPGRIGAYKVLVNHLMQTYFYERRGIEYADIDFLCWCFPKDRDPYLRRESREIENAMSGYHWGSYGTREYKMLVQVAKEKKDFEKNAGELETARRLAQDLLQQRKEI